MSAQVDAATGELLGFNLPYMGPGNDQPVIDQKQAQTISRRFHQTDSTESFSGNKTFRRKSLHGFRVS